MGDLIKATPGIIVLLLGLASLGFGVSWLMTTEPPFGPLGTLGAVGGYVAAWLIAFKAFTS
jgi:hypothetical protein